MYICLCHAVNEKKLKDSIQKGNQTICDIMSDIEIAKQCRKCVPSIMHSLYEESKGKKLLIAKKSCDESLECLHPENHHVMEDIPDYGDLMTKEEFLQCVQCSAITPDDGTGFWATKEKMSDISVWDDTISTFTHVVWFNK